MTRGRLVVAGLVAGIGLSAGVMLRLAWAAPPTGCTFPGAPDNFAAVVPGQNLTTTMFNRMLCALNALEAQLAGVAGKVAETRCVNVTVAAGARVLVNVAVTRPLVGTEAVFASAIDGASPSRLVDDGIQSRTGTTVRGYVWNRDADASHSGQYCVEAWPL